MLTANFTKLAILVRKIGGLAIWLQIQQQGKIWLSLLYSSGVLALTFSSYLALALQALSNFLFLSSCMQLLLFSSSFKSSLLTSSFALATCYLKESNLKMAYLTIFKLILVVDVKDNDEGSDTIGAFFEAKIVRITKV